jgi:hypothetical protein
MEEYILIKTYPGSPPLGYQETNPNEFNFCKKYPEFWEEIVEDISVYHISNSLTCNHPGGSAPYYIYMDKESYCKIHNIRYFYCEKDCRKWADKQVGKKDYEILKFKDSVGNVFYKKQEDNLFTINLQHSYTEEKLLNHNITIYSVKRLSDGEVFTVGDRVCIDVFWETGKPSLITKFKISKNNELEFVVTQNGIPGCYYSSSKFYHYVEPVKKNYEILSYISKLKNCIIYPKDPLFDNGEWDIHSVKRLSDNVEFTIGDKICKGIITSFSIRNQHIIDCEVNHNKMIHFSINKILHIKKPLFTTEDGVDIFEGDDYFELLNLEKIFKVKLEKNKILTSKNSRKVFSTKEAAEEYIFSNKPCLSLNDVAQVFVSINRKQYNGKYYIQAEKIRKLVKSKL